MEIVNGGSGRCTHNIIIVLNHYTTKINQKLNKIELELDSVEGDRGTIFLGQYIGDFGDITNIGSLKCAVI